MSTIDPHAHSSREELTSEIKRQLETIVLGDNPSEREPHKNKEPKHHRRLDTVLLALWVCTYAALIGVFNLLRRMEGGGKRAT